jgi:hypothetical protein
MFHDITWAGQHRRALFEWLRLRFDRDANRSTVKLCPIVDISKSYSKPYLKLLVYSKFNVYCITTVIFIWGFLIFPYGWNAGAPAKLSHVNNMRWRDIPQFIFQTHGIATVVAVM